MQPTRAPSPAADRSEIPQPAPPSASCFWCQRLHLAPHPLSICSECAARYTTMRQLEMSGSYPLSDQQIDAILKRRSPGNYALGHMDGDEFRVFYVGRSDSDLKQRLHEWVGMPSQYDSYASSAKASWGVHHRGQLPLNGPALARVSNVESSYTRFAYSYACSAEEACAKEWRNYDAFGGSRCLDNEVQPIPAGG